MCDLHFLLNITSLSKHKTQHYMVLQDNIATVLASVLHIQSIVIGLCFKFVMGNKLLQPQVHVYKVRQEKTPFTFNLRELPEGTLSV